METVTPKKGLTWRSALALIFAIGAVQPAMIYYMLLTNEPLGLQAWFVILLWWWISRSIGTPLSRQELFILLSFQSMAVTYAMSFVTPIQYMYYRVAPTSVALGVSQYMPDWFAPPSNVVKELMHTQWVFFHPCWVKPILVMLTFTFLGIVADIAMGYFAYSLYSRTEKLTFPAARAEAQTVITLAEGDPQYIRYLTIGAFVGMVYNALVSFIPYIIGPYLSAIGTGGPIIYQQISPIAQIYDFTTILARSLPGAGFAATLNLLTIAPGLVLPVRTTLGILIGALALYFFATHIVTIQGWWPAEATYETSWTYDLLSTRALLYFGWSIIIGLSIAAVAAPLILQPRTFIRSFTALKLSETGGSYKLLLLLFLGACLASALIVYFLTGFPLWILIPFTVLGSFFLSFLSTNAAGVTMTGLDIPYLKELMIYSSGWPGKAIWFAPVTMYTGGAGIAIRFMQADLLGASRSEYVKTYILVVIGGLLGSFLFVSYLWNISPIPSGAYPATIITWPVTALEWARFQIWVWKGYFFRKDVIFWSFVVGTVFYAITARVFKMPWILITIVTGMTYGIPVALAQFTGSIIGNYVLKPLLEKLGGSYSDFAGRFWMGIVIGAGFLDLMRALLILISRSMWLLPY